MKKLFLKFSIFVLLISACACFVFPGNNNKPVYAATTTDCYYMTDGEGIYQANKAVGQVQGGGEFVVGAENVEIIATSNKNYQIVGWQITYKDQSNKTEFIDSTGLNGDYEKIVKLTPNGVQPENGVDATLSFTYNNGIFTASSFKLSYVFEDLKIVPVFDNVYYDINISSLVEISSFEKSKQIGSDILYYDQEITESSVTTYKNAYFKIDGNYFYFGNVYSDGTNYYTLKTTQEATPRTYKVDYKKGSFVYGDQITIQYDVDIDEGDITASKNIDLIGVGITTSSNSTTLAPYIDDMDNNYYKAVKDEDSYFRTTSYELKFNILESQDFTNTINLTYHNLYVVDLIVSIDGTAIDLSDENKAQTERAKLDEIFGDITATQNDIQSNLLINNFYSVTNANNTQFLVKNAQDNAFKDFKINVAKQITKTIDGTTYLYYNFVSLNGQANNSASYASISGNTIIAIDFETVDYKVEFKLAEYFIDSNLNATLIEMEGDALSSLYLKRGDEKTLESSDVSSITNYGYKFVGFATSFDEKIPLESFTYEVDETKPLGLTILLCYQKISYQVVFANYNSIDVSGTHALESITFVKTGATQTTKTLVSNDFESSLEMGVGYKPLVLTDFTMKLGDKLAISEIVNNGFVVLGYNFDESSDEYVDFTNFELTGEIIENNSFDDEQIVIYIHEGFDDFSLTYYIDPTYDPNEKTNVIMAGISVEASTGVVTKYTFDDIEISEENNNLTATVVKIVISGLKLNDKILLESIPVNNTYMFNWFTEDNTSRLDSETSEVEGKVYYNHQETIRKTRTIKVVYSMEKTILSVSYDESFGAIPEFVQGISFKVYQNGKEIPSHQNDINIPDDDPNSFDVEMGEIQFEIITIGFGYEFVGYVLNKEEPKTPQRLTFSCNLTSKNNDLVLKFKRVNYNFYFKQYGADLDGNYVDFNERSYVQLNIDNRITEITKPEGYYVGVVTFGKDKSDFDGSESNLQEFNSYRNNENILIYTFSLSRNDFINIVDQFQKEDQGVISIEVHLEYFVFTYDITVAYGLTQPKGNGLDSKVQYPDLNITYEFDGVSTTRSTIIENNLAIFNKIPYGAVTTISLVGQVQNGLSVSGWRFKNGDVIFEKDYEHSSNHIKLGAVKKDIGLQYKFSYISYSLELVYNSKEGAPKVKVNNIGVNISQIQVTLFDKIEINAEALRTQGYKFKSFSYNIPKYTAYEYTTESWQDEHLNLYILKNDQYIKNTSDEYVPENKYFVYSEEMITFAESSQFIINDFRVSDYALSKQKVFITIEYELLKFSLSHETIEAKGGSYGTLYNDGKGIGKKDVTIGQNNSAVKILINPTDYLIITISRYQDDQFIDIDALETVSFYDQIKINIAINQQAKNHDGTVYDLSKGLEISKVTIAGQKFKDVNDLGNGSYSVVFSVGQYIDYIADENVEIDYYVGVKQKTVIATTEINSESFHKETQFTFNAYDYGFSLSTQISSKAKDLTEDFQFLTVLKVSFQFLNESTYNGHFNVIGVQIYCNNTYIGMDQYDDYNITILDDYSVVARLSYNLKVVYKISPEINFKGGSNFEKTFKCDNLGNGISQTLTVGSSEDCDIQLAEIIKDCLVVRFVNPNKPDNILTSVTDCGDYDVILSFKQSGEYDWLSQIVVDGVVKLKITPKSLYVSYDENNIPSVSKVYDGTSSWDPKNIYSYLKFTDNESVNIAYGKGSDNNLRFNNEVMAYITSDGKDNPVADADDGAYNLYVYNLKLIDNVFNNNFVIINADLIIPNSVTIKRKELLLSGVSRANIKDKMFDDTNIAYWATTDNIELQNKYAEDDVSIDKEKLILLFEDKEIGHNKTVTLDTSEILVGTKAKNYYVKNMTISGISIYPSSLKVNVFGVGEVEVINLRGATEYDKVGLIPVDSRLVVEAIRAEDAIYAEIYATIEKHLKGRVEFAIGYQIYMIVNGTKVPVNNDLYLSIPSVKDSTGIYFLTGSQTGEIGAKTSDDRFIIDLQQIDFDVDKIFITINTVLLKPWQIALIVITAVAVVVAVVLTFVIIRKRKFREYSEQEKI